MGFHSTLKWEPRTEEHSRLSLNLEFRLEGEEGWDDGIKWFLYRGPEKEEITAARALKLARRLGARDAVEAILREGAERARRAEERKQAELEDEVANRVKYLGNAARTRRHAEEQVAILLDGADA